MELIERSREREESRQIRVLPRVLPLLGSIQDDRRLTELMQTWRPDLIYHAAAHNDEQMIESNMTEGVKNNLLATIAVVKTALEQQVPKFVLLSTDQALQPTNTMGCAKRVEEMMLQALMAEEQPPFNRLGEPPMQIKRNTELSIVRYGTLFDTSSAIVKKFRKQIQNGGPVTLPDKEARHPFMTIQEAVQLLLQAGAMSGEPNRAAVFMLDRGKPMSIYHLALQMVELSGLRVKDQAHPDGDIEIRLVELPTDREKGELLWDGEKLEPTEHPAIMRAEETFIPWAALQSKLYTLQIAAENNDVEMIRLLFRKLVKAYQPDEKIVDSVYREQSYHF
ncbi:MAG: polysaccharide biosynthesis protein [Gammaproteobacteria bacterium]|nr:polysaccharide biosynthesis protein [Gammaproteobacteria bacterium]